MRAGQAQQKLKKNYGSFRTVSTDVQNGDTLTYSQFPITRQLTIKYSGGIGSPYIDLHVKGFAVEGCPDTTMLEGDHYIQQNSDFILCIPDSSDYEEDGESSKE